MDRICPALVIPSIEVINHEGSIFRGSDTLYIEFREPDFVESKDLDENTILDRDVDGQVCAISFEHAGERTDVHHLTVEGIAAQAAVRQSMGATANASVQAPRRYKEGGFPYSDISSVDALQFLQFALYKYN